jgi:hypothetical protein
MSSKPALIVTIAVAVLAIAAVIFTVVLVGSRNSGGADGGNQGGGNQGSTAPIFTPDEELEAEMQAAAAVLVENNFEVFQLFYTAPYEKDAHFEPEPYGNEPEDGYYTLKEGVIEKYKTVDEIFALVDATFVETAAAQIKNDDSRTEQNGPLYKARDGRIGVNARYKPANAEKPESVEVRLNFVSETESIIVIEYGAGADTGVPTTVQMPMQKGDDGIWRLENLIVLLPQNA